MKIHNIALENRAVKTNPALPTIIAVDDDEDSLVLLSYIIEDLPCLFFCETDGKAALEMILSLKPSLILLDVWLPSLSGFDIVRRLKNSIDTALIPVIAITALAGRHQQEKLLAAGFDYYICKPYSLVDLQAVVKRYLLASSPI